MVNYIDEIINIILNKKFHISIIEIGTNGLLTNILTKKTNKFLDISHIFNSIVTLKSFFNSKANLDDEIIDDCMNTIMTKFRCDICFCAYIKDNNNVYSNIFLLEKKYKHVFKLTEENIVDEATVLCLLDIFNLFKKITL